MWICARSALILVTKRPLAWMQKTSWRAFTKNKYRIKLDHQIVSGHGALYPQALYNGLIFELMLADASNVVIGSDAAKLVYKLTNIQLE